MNFIYKFESSSIHCILYFKDTLGNMSSHPPAHLPTIKQLLVVAGA